MKSVELRQKLHHYIETAQEKKLKAIYTMVEDEIVEEYNHWSDADFVKEMNKRLNELEKGNTRSYAWDEVKKKAVKSIRAAKSGK